MSAETTPRRLYSVRLHGSSEPITVAVLVRDNYRNESHEAIMLARNCAESWLGHRVLASCERGPLIYIAPDARS